MRHLSTTCLTIAIFCTALLPSSVLAQELSMDPQGSSAIVNAVRWMQGTVLGTVATVVSVIAIASVGFLMLTGRIEIRRGFSVLLGCFVLFGARGIAEGLRSTAQDDDAPFIAAAPVPPNIQTPKPQSNRVDAFDPYAGAAVLQPER
jgi:type IV secretion system protein VirB2